LWQETDPTLQINAARLPENDDLRRKDANTNVGIVMLLIMTALPITRTMTVGRRKRNTKRTPSDLLNHRLRPLKRNRKRRLKRNMMRD
jgi:hypothetical protein